MRRFVSLVFYHSLQGAEGSCLHLFTKQVTANRCNPCLFSLKLYRDKVQSYASFIWQYTWKTSQNHFFFHITSALNIITPPTTTNKKTRGHFSKTCIISSRIAWENVSFLSKRIEGVFEEPQQTKTLWEPGALTFYLPSRTLEKQKSYPKGPNKKGQNFKKITKKKYGSTGPHLYFSSPGPSGHLVSNPPQSRAKPPLQRL